MKRTKKLATSVTPEEKSDFRVEAAKQDMDMAELLRELTYDFLEEEGHETSRSEDGTGNRTPAATAAE
jgi:hypothetical protein